MNTTNRTILAVWTKKHGDITNQIALWTSGEVTIRTNVSGKIEDWKNIQGASFPIEDTLISRMTDTFEKQGYVRDYPRY